MRVALCLEQTLGHRAHAVNLQAAVGDNRHDIRVVDVTYEANGRIPWAFRGSWKAARQANAAGRADIRFFHTQSIALFAPLVARGRPFVVSVDATPLQLDEMGSWYGHGKSGGPLEAVKLRWYRAVFQRAAAVVAWSEWAAASLVRDYGVRRQRILVAHPGAPRPFFEIERAPASDERPTILFVGGDLRRKGGDLLLGTFPRLSQFAHLLMVTTDDVPPMEGVEVIGNATPGSARLAEAYARADIFCLPTRGDCTPVVLGEAMAAGLPVVTTRIGSNAETVTDGLDGLLVDVDDGPGLEAALWRLISDEQHRVAMGAAARATARERFDAAVNAKRIFELLESLA